MNNLNACFKRLLWTLSVSILLLCSISLHAQNEPSFTQYMFNESFINPAYAGSHEYFSATGLYRNQWVGIEGSPNTETFSIHAPVAKRKLGLGLSVMNESIGVSHQLMIKGNFAYRILMPTSVFAFGLQAGFVNHQEDLMEIHTTVSGDNQFSSNVREYFLPNAGFGMYFKTDRFYAGFSIPRLLENKISASQAEVVVRNIGNPEIWHYYFATGYVTDLSENIKFKPSIMVKAVANSPVEMDLNANFLFNELIWIGAGYRTGDAVSAMFGIQLSKNLRLNYSYDYTLSALQQFNSGSHEFALQYDISLEKDKFISPRYF